MNLKVLDLSHHNDGLPGEADIDFKALFQFGIRGIIHKSSQGVAMVDRMYARRRDAALAAGLLWGAYHFATGDDPQEQVDHFFRSAKPDAQTLMALDHENNHGDELSLAEAKQFLKFGDEQLGRSLVIYSGNLIKEQLGMRPDPWLASHRLWLAQYGPVAKVPLAWKVPGLWLWQFSGDGVNNHGIKVPGIARGNTVDMNTYDGTDGELEVQWPGDEPAPAAVA